MKKILTKTQVATWPGLLSKSASKTLLAFIFIFLSVLFPSLLAHTPQNQWITGTLVNAVLFFSTFKVGPWATIPVAVLPSLFALSRGLLPPTMTFLLPFVITSNLILIFSFWLISKKSSPKLAIFSSSFLKFLFLYGIVSFLLSKTIPSQVIFMMKWPQLATALGGGFLALGIKISWRFLLNLFPRN